MNKYKNYVRLSVLGMVIEIYGLGMVLLCFSLWILFIGILLDFIFY
jgi:hypothetical protein